MPKIKLPLKKSPQDKLKDLQKVNAKLDYSKENNLENSDLLSKNSQNFDSNSDMKSINSTNSETNFSENEQKLETEETKTESDSQQVSEISSTEMATKIIMENLQKELEDWKNRAFRLTADLTNAGKQEEINLTQTRKNSKKSIVNLLLPFLNTLHLSFAFLPAITDEKVQKFVKTLQNSFQELVRDLGMNGVEILIPNSGTAFDPLTMAALNSPSDDQNIIIKEVVSVGLRINNQLVHPVSVTL